MKAQRETVGYGTEGGEGSSRVLLTLVIPTRNEVDNVPELVAGLRESLMGVDYRVVFVDDSTDGTPAVIKDLAREDARVSLVRREGAERRGGLSTAVTRGLDLSSDVSEYTCVMDADLQHPPEKVREMLETARRTDADVVVASRYAEGGSYTGDGIAVIVGRRYREAGGVAVVQGGRRRCQRGQGCGRVENDFGRIDRGLLETIIDGHSQADHVIPRREARGEGVRCFRAHHHAILPPHPAADL